MTDNPRDTKFAGFAELLYQELSTLEGSHETVLSEYRNKYDKQAIVQLIAQRAYDLAYHILYETGSGMERAFGIPYKLEQVPDLTQWPESPDSE